LNKLDRIRSASVLRNACIGVIDISIVIKHHVLEHRAEAQRLKNVWFVFWR
jgi:hypothetical protein